MNTEKSIKLMKVIKEILPEHYNFDFGKPEIDEVIRRLQMWEDFKKKYKHNAFEKLNKDECVQEKDLVGNIMDNFEKEHFHIPHIPNVIEVEVLAENRDVIDELAKEIEDMNGQQFRAGKIRVVSTRWVRE